MKSPKFLLAAVAVFMSLASFSQVDTTKKDTTNKKTDTTKKKPTSINESAFNNSHNQQSTVAQFVSTAANTNADRLYVRKNKYFAKNSNS